MDWQPYGSIITNDDARRSMVEKFGMQEGDGGHGMVWLLVRLGYSDHEPARSRRLPLTEILPYNPLAYHLETNAARELVVTLTRATAIAPKLRYNIHDLGHTARFEQGAPVLAECGLAHLVEETAAARLSLLFLYGRSDLSVDYYGANVTPDSVHEILFSLDEACSSSACDGQPGPLWVRARVRLRGIG